MVFRVLLYIALTVFILGLVYKVSLWFSRTIGLSPANNLFRHRVSAFFQGFIGVLSGRKVWKLLKSLLLDVILQRRTFKENVLRWVMHIMIYAGFMLLLLMHGLGNIITASLFHDYYPTANPFFLLRDLFGLMVIAGIGISVFRRFVLRIPRFMTNWMDGYALIILAVILFSGFLLEGVKITSYSDFKRMVEDYSDLEQEKDIVALESLWVKEFDLVSPNVSKPFDPELLKRGMEYHEMNCMGCHASPKQAFAGNLVAKWIGGAALFLDRVRAEDFLYYIHILACFLGLAYLPFSRMFHILSTPVSLLANSVMDPETSDPANIATRQVMELDACTHCGTCTRFCSAMMGYEAVHNKYILPSEKMVLLKKIAAGKTPGREEFMALQEGVYLCTNCDRCTVVCPSGIRLKELWVSVREKLIEQGIPEPLLLSPLSLVRGLNRNRLTSQDYSLPLGIAREAVTGQFGSPIHSNETISFPEAGGNGKGLSFPDDTFSYCFGCHNCTTVCPVVCSYENPQETLGLLPHQIMCCLGLGLDEMALSSNMLWDCVTCYQCQEHCPQQVEVADILYDLRNMAIGEVIKKA